MVRRTVRLAAAVATTFAAAAALTVPASAVEVELAPAGMTQGPAMCCAPQ